MRLLCLAVLLLSLSAGGLRAQTLAAATATPGLLCRAAVGAAERSAGIPSGLLAAIARVESGRRDAATGAINPWPWTANAEGQGYFFDSKAEAVAAVRAMQARGIQSIDVGCGQINLKHHPDAFASLEAAFDPATNAAYAARFLKELFAQTGDWTRATAMYHSATPELGDPYQRKVASIWPEERQVAGLIGPAVAPAVSGTALPMFTRIARLQPGEVAGPRVIMLPTVGGLTPPGRSLDSYRAAPIGLAFQPPPRRSGS
jgi:Transglycosylase SLT domain